MSTDISIGITRTNMSRTYKLIITYINYFFNKISNIVSKKTPAIFVRAAQRIINKLVNLVYCLGIIYLVQINPIKYRYHLQKTPLMNLVSR